MYSAQEEFRSIVKSVTDTIGPRAPDAALQADLNARFPAHGKVYEQILQACRNAIDAGWMCKYEQGGIHYGRVIKPDDDLAGYSVDVVQMHNIAGPRNRHPNGEIDLIMPLDDAAKLEGTQNGSDAVRERRG